MAVIVPGSIVADIRGSVGAETYSRTQGGLVVKSKPIPTQTASTKRDQIQANLTAVTQAWSGRLTALQRKNWGTYGHQWPRPNRWGDPIITSGYLAYVRCNCTLKLINPALWIDEPPALGMLPIPTFTIYSFLTTTQNVFITLDPFYQLVEEYYLIISMGKTTNTGVSYYSSPWQIKQASRWWDGDWNPYIEYMDLGDWPGTLTRVWIKAFMYDSTTGRLSIPFQATCISVPG